MEHQNLFEKIKQTSESGIVQPSNAVWDRLEERLDEENKVIEDHMPRISLTTKLAFAASILIIIGAYSMLNNLGTVAESSTAIKLENLHTLEVNPRFNIQMAGESSTIPSVRTIRATPALYKSPIKEGSSEKRIIIKKVKKNEQKEYGLG